MQMISLSAHFDGEQILLDEPFHMEPNSRLLITLLPYKDEEREAWFHLSAQRLEQAYGSDEPDYEITEIQEVLPHDARR